MDSPMLAAKESKQVYIAEQEWYRAILYIFEIIDVEAKHRCYRRLLTGVKALRRAQRHLRMEGPQDGLSMDEDVRNIMQYCVALLNYKEDPREKCIGLCIVSTLMSYIYPASSFVKDAELVSGLKRLASSVLCTAIDLHGHMSPYFHLKGPTLLPAFLDFACQPHIYMCHNTDVKQPLFHSWRQTMHIAHKCREQSSYPSTQLVHYPSHTWIASLFSNLLSMECLQGSVKSSMALLKDVLQQGNAFSLDVSKLEGVIVGIFQRQMKNKFKSAMEVSAIIDVLTRKPILTQVDATHRTIFLWTLKKGAGAAAGADAKGAPRASDASGVDPVLDSCAPLWSSVCPQFSPAITYLAVRAYRVLQSIAVPRFVTYYLLDALICVMVGLPVTGYSHIPLVHIKHALKQLVALGYSNETLDSVTKCSLVCFWNSQQANIDAKHSPLTALSFHDLVYSFLSNLTPVLLMSSSEMHLCTSMFKKSGLDMQKMKEKIPWLVECGVKYRPYMCAMYTIEHANLLSSSIEFSTSIIRVLNYQRTLKKMGLNSVFKRLRSHLEEVVMSIIHKEVQKPSEVRTNVSAKLSQLMCNLLNYILLNPDCAESNRMWVFDIVKLLFIEDEQLMWNRACIIGIMKIWCSKYNKEQKKFFEWYFDVLGSALDEEVMTSLLCVALYAQGDFMVGRTMSDGALEEEMRHFREQLMKRVLESMSLTAVKKDVRAIQLIMQALSFDRVTVVNELKDFLKIGREDDASIERTNRLIGKVLDSGAGGGMNISRSIPMNLGMAMGNAVALPLFNEILNSLYTTVNANASFEKKGKRNFWKRSVATCFQEHKPWQEDVAMSYTDNDEFISCSKILQMWESVLQQRSSAMAYDKHYVFSVVSRIMKAFCVDVEVWNERLDNLNQMPMFIRQCIDFCLEKHNHFGFAAECLRRRVANVIMLWLHKGSRHAPCLYSSGLKDVGDVAKWEEPFFGRALRVTGTVQFPLAMKLLEIDYKHTRIWIEPTMQRNIQFSLHDTSPKALMNSLWKFYPSMADLALHYYAESDENASHLAALVYGRCLNPVVQSNAKYANLLMKYAHQFPTEWSYHALDLWERASPIDCVDYMHVAHPCVEQYIMQSVRSGDVETLRFIVPQMIQALRNPDAVPMIAEMLTYLGKVSTNSLMFVLWNLDGEKTPPPEAFNPAVKRSGWRPPEDSGLWEVTEGVLTSVMQSVSDDDKRAVSAFMGYYNALNDISDGMGDIPSAFWIETLRTKLRDIPPPPPDLAIPFDTDVLVDSIVVDKCITLPSAAKIPILVNFNTRQREGTDGRDGRNATGQGMGAQGEATSTTGCIFKVGDDCRQDVLALQVVSVLKRTFQQNGLELFLHVYHVIPTGYEKGLIEVVANTKSRSGLGELSDGGLLQIFKQKFGPPGGSAFERARMNFIRSCAGYAVASYILWAKDRHNGNILFDQDTGHMIHIDFGFILGISPGGNLGFETAGFKLSHEYTQIIDPGGRRTSKEYLYFKKLCMVGFLAARRQANLIMSLVTHMAQSGLPCFGYGKPIAWLRERLMLDEEDDNACMEFEAKVEDAYCKTTTSIYDVVQLLQNGIPV